MRYAARLAWTVVVACGWTGLAAAADRPSQAGLGDAVANVAVTDTQGKTHHLHDLKDRKAIAVVFLSFECPVSNSYSEPLTELARVYEPKGVAVVGISMGEEDAAGIAKRVKEFKLNFPVYPDAKFKAADAFQAGHTPEAFVLDGNFVMRYRGRIDDSYTARLKKKNDDTIRQDLKIALDEVLAGKAVTEPATLAIGCPLARPRATGTTSAKVTYHRDVLPILQNHCQSCHRPGEVAPFSLMTYRHAVNWAEDIKSFTAEKKMPPWKPVEGLPFHNERRLSDQDIATLAAWVDAGTPEGDLKDAQPARKFSDGWQLGTPDLILKPNDSFHLAGAGRDVFRCFVLGTALDEDKYVTGIEVRPGNRRVVHHALIFVDTSGGAKKLETKEQERKKDGEKDHGPGYSSSMGIGIRPSGGLGGWAPGQMARHLPEGTGYFLPKGADVVVQLHYHRDGREADDTTSVGLYFAKKPVAKKFQSVVIPGRFLFIPSGNEHFKTGGSVVVQQDCELHSVMPHMHMLGKEVKVTMFPPEGEATKTLVAIKDWDYNWQETYFFKESVKVKAGTRLEIQGVYDNSAKNPSNPNKPPKLVWNGQETTNEMLFGFLGATTDKPGRIRVQFLKPGENPPAK
jgi:peroxiredoxin